MSVIDFANISFTICGYHTYKLYINSLILNYWFYHTSVSILVLFSFIILLPMNAFSAPQQQNKDDHS